MTEATQTTFFRDFFGKEMSENSGLANQLPTGGARQNDGGYSNDIFPRFFRQRDVRKFGPCQSAHDGGGAPKCTPVNSSTPARRSINGARSPTASFYGLGPPSSFLENLQQNSMAPILARFFFKDTLKRASKPVQQRLLNFPVIFIYFHSSSLFRSHLFLPIRFTTHLQTRKPPTGGSPAKTLKYTPT